MLAIIVGIVPIVLPYQEKALGIINDTITTLNFSSGCNVTILDFNRSCNVISSIVRILVVYNDIY